MPGGVAQTTALNDGITAIDTEYERPLHDASHLIVNNGCAAFVDTGVNDSVPLLLDALQQQDIDPADVDYVFVTHVHLDHAGGAGTLMQALPNAKCVCDPRAARHMIDPARLVAGTEAVYGKEKTRAIYGVIEAVDEARIEIGDDGKWFDLNGRPLQTLHMEGHAKHHYVLNDPQSKGVFTGDCFGVSYREFDTDRGEIVFPTTTPVQFDPVEAHKSIDRIMDLEPEQLFLTHYSRVSDLDRLAQQMHEGIDAHVAIALEYRDEDARLDVIRAKLMDYYTGRIRDNGYAGSDDAIVATMSLESQLNAQGLEVWLDRQ